MVSILTGDLLLVDESRWRMSDEDLSRLSDAERRPHDDLRTLFSRHNLVEGKKDKITPLPEEFSAFTDAIASIPYDHRKPGGTAANILTAVKGVFGSQVQVNFIGVAGDDVYGRLAKASLQEASINLLDIPHAVPAESAFSYVFVNPLTKGRIIVTNPGNAGKILLPSIVRDEMVENTDVVFLGGGLWKRAAHEERTNDNKLLRFADKLFDLRWRNEKDGHPIEAWLALPTDEIFARQESKRFRYLIASMDLVMGNMEELGYIYEDSSLYKRVREECPALDREKALLACLQSQLAERDGIRKDQKKPERSEEAEAIGFITDGEKGAYVVTPHGGIQHVDVAPISKDEIENLVGAGDAAFAGYIIGHLGGLTPRESARLGMLLAGEKLKVNQARLDNPQQALTDLRDSFQTRLTAAFQSINNEVQSGVVETLRSDINILNKALDENRKITLPASRQPTAQPDHYLTGMPVFTNGQSTAAFNHLGA